MWRAHIECNCVQYRVYTMRKIRHGGARHLRAKLPNPWWLGLFLYPMGGCNRLCLSHSLIRSFGLDRVVAMKRHDFPRTSLEATARHWHHRHRHRTGWNEIELRWSPAKSRASKIRNYSSKFHFCLILRPDSAAVPFINSYYSANLVNVFYANFVRINCIVYWR